MKNKPKKYALILIIAGFVIFMVFPMVEAIMILNGHEVEPYDGIFWIWGGPKNMGILFWLIGLTILALEKSDKDKEQED